MLGSLVQAFEGIFAGGGGGGDLSFAANTHIQGGHIQTLSSLHTLPGRVNQGTVEREAHEAGKAKAQALLMREFVKHRSSRIQASVQQYATAASHQQGVMRAQQNVARTTARHREAIAQHGLVMGETRQYVDGYTQAFNGASNFLGGIL